MKLALEALESDPITHAGLVSRKQAITALRQALETEPVVCHKDHTKGYEEFEGKCLLCVIDKLMSEIGDLLIKNCTAGEREWQGLTAPEVQECYDLNPARFASRIEAKLKEKNT